MRAREAVVGNRRVWVFITQCAWCRGIKVGPWFLRKPRPPLMVWREQITLPYLPVVVVSMTHGACPECARQVNERARRSRLRHGFSTAGPDQKDVST